MAVCALTSLLQCAVRVADQDSLAVTVTGHEIALRVLLEPAGWLDSLVNAILGVGVGAVLVCE